MKHFPLIILLCLPAATLAQEDDDKGYLTRLIEDNLSGDSRIVNIVGFQGALSSNATLDQLTVADSEGVWLTLEDVSLVWTRSALLRGALDVDSLSAARIIVARAPVSPANDLPPAEATPFALPELPVSIALGQLSIDRIELGPAFLGEDLAFSVSGSAGLAGGEGNVNIQADRLDGKAGAFVIDGSYQNASRVLEILLDVDEGPDGIIARLADLPDRPALALNMSGDAPLDDFAASLSLATDGEDRLTGDFTLTQTEAESRFSVDLNGDIQPLLPVAYRDFFGNEVALVANGRQAETGFDLETLDLTTQKLRLTGAAALDAEGWPERLSLSGAVADPSGDIVLLPIAGADTFVNRVDLNIGYDRALSDDWTADFDISGFDRPGLFIQDITLTGGGTILSGGGASVGSVTANMTYGATGLELDDAATAQALGDSMTGQFELTYAEGDPTRISRLTLNGPGIALLADATIQGPEDGFATQANAMVSAERLARFAALAGQPGLAGAADLTVTAQTRPLDGTFDVDLSGQTMDLATGIAQLDPLLRGTGTLSVQAVRDTEGTRLDGLRIATQEAQITATANLTSTDSAAEFDISLRELGLVVEGLEGPAQVQGNARRDASGTTVFDIAGTGPAASLTATGTAQEAESITINADIAASVDDLTRYQTISGQPLSGAIDLTLDGVLLVDGLRFDADLAATTQDLETGVAQLDPLLAGAGSVALSLARTGADNFRLETLDLTTPQARVMASGTYEGTGASGDFDVTLNDVGLISPDLNGPASLRGTARRTGAGTTEFDVSGTGPAATLTARGTLTEDDIPRLTADVTAAVSNLALYSQIAGRDLGGAVDLSLSGSARTDGSLFDAQLSGTTQDLITGVDQLDPLLQGAGRISGGVARTGADSFALEQFSVTTPHVDLTATGSGGLSGPAAANLELTLTDAATALPGLTGPLALRLDGTRDLTEAGQVALELNGIGTALDLNATIAPPAEDYRITGNLTADINNLAPFAALAGQQISGGLNVDITGSGLPDLSTLDAVLDLRSDNLRVGIAQADQLLAGIGTVSAQLQRAGETITVPRFAVQTPQISANGTVQTNGTTGQADFEARLANIGLFTDQLSGPVTAGGSASLNANGLWGLDITANGPGGIGARAGGTVAPGGDLNLTLTGNAPLGLANTILDPRRINGDAAFDLAINGPPALGSVSGRISTNGARLANPSLGISVEDITGGVNLNGETATIDLGAAIQSGGRVTLSGPIGLTAPFTANVTATLDDVVLRDPALYETAINGAVTASGALTGGAQITGDLTLGQTDVQVPSSGIGALGALPDVVHIGADGTVRQTLDRAGITETPQSARNGESGGGSGPVYPLNVTINAPSRIFIRGRGVDAELGGALTIGGTTANLIPTGQFDLIRGRINILQQRFDLDEGSVTMQGDFIPVIRLVATTEASTGTIIQIIVSGPADAPEVTFESTPELPQDEVLSQLIFGRNLSDISPLQAVQLASAVATLAGRGGTGLIDGFRQGIGLDDFDVTTDEAGNAALRAGAYLSDNVYTDVTINSEGDTEINLNLDITSEITAKGTAGADGETSIGVFFERDY